MDDERAGLTYQKFIDEMVYAARRSVSADRIAAHGHTERANEVDLPLDRGEALQKGFCQGLGPEQKVILAQLLVNERETAVHDILAYLEWAVTMGKLSLSGASGSFAGEAAQTMHADFISRLAGYEWREI